MARLDTLTDLLASLADPTRLRILSLLEEEELAVHELLHILGGSQSSLSTHLSRLKKCGLVTDRRDGTRSYYRSTDGDAGAEARAAWTAVRQSLVDDGRLEADRTRLREVLTQRREESWADRVAGALHRQYIPGRSWESVAFCLAGLLDLGDVVDLGSGDGALVSLLAPQARRYVCVDLSRRMVEAGQRRVARAGVTNAYFVVGDMAAPPLPLQSADTVLLLQSLQYAEDPPRALSAAMRLLRRRGRCVVLTLAEHEDQAMAREFGHRHLGFSTRKLSTWLKRASGRVRTLTTASMEHRSPHLRTLLAIAEP